MQIIHVGTSGWNYSHWQGVFYPHELSPRKWLSFYATYFDTVEVNATFYGSPKEKTFRNWYKSTPDNFIFAVKANRFITHVRRLRDVKEEIKRFYQTVAPLEEKLRVILFQLPPSLKFDQVLIEEFLSLLNSQYQTTIEVRNKTFNNPVFFSLLRDANVALCISDTAGRYPSLIEELTADFFYIRLHGSRTLYRSCYTEEELKMWKEKILHFGLPGYVYFDNDALGWAVPNALHLKALLGQKIKPLSEEAKALLKQRPLD